MHVLNKGIMRLSSPADFLGKIGMVTSGNPFAKISPLLATQFSDIVANRYDNNIEAALRSFI